MERKIVIDCGTTNLRVSIVDENRKILARVKRAGGVKYTAVDGHNGRLRMILSKAISEAMEQANIKPEEVSYCVASGMITSNLGLLEIPHLGAPASVRTLHNAMCTAFFADIAPLPITFIPGVRNDNGKVNLQNYSSIDMMRGEEVEALGLYKLLGLNEEAVLVLPGSHNKFVRMGKEGGILGCMTSISGELLDAVTNSTILADSVEHRFVSVGEYDPEMICEGALECFRSGLGRALFSGRILKELGAVPSNSLRNFLLGAVLAQDILALREWIAEAEKPKIVVSGNYPVGNAFMEVLKMSGFDNVMLASNEITQMMGLAGALMVYEGMAD